MYGVTYPARIALRCDACGDCTRLAPILAIVKTQPSDTALDNLGRRSSLESHVSQPKKDRQAHVR